MPKGVDVKNWMSGDPVSVEPEASALEALERMLNRGIRHLPVLDSGRRVVGVLSIDDLRAALPFPVRLGAVPSPKERELAREWSVGEVMSHAPETIREGASLAEAAQRMGSLRIGCLPVVDAEGRLAGILSETDVLQALATVLWSDAVRERRAESSELEQLAALLGRERAAIAERLDRLPANERDLSMRRLQSIDQALAHASQGRLGVCERCGGAIPVTRLRALPGTALCVACASE